MNEITDRFHLLVARVYVDLRAEGGPFTERPREVKIRDRLRLLDNLHALLTPEMVREAEKFIKDNH